MSDSSEQDADPPELASSENDSNTSDINDPGPTEGNPNNPKMFDIDIPSQTVPNAAQSKHNEPMPDHLGPFQVDSVLGAGGMGTVYRGTHSESGKVVAIKVLPASLARDPGLVERFHREIGALKSLKNEHVVRLVGRGEQQDQLFYAMEYVQGETMSARIRARKRLPWEEVIEYGIQICSALKAAHDAGFIHRDLKPSNLMIDEDDQIKLTDFGVAQVFAASKLTVTGGVIGTVEYMSPEQAEGRRVSKQSDIYSLGAVLYAMLTGRPPFVGKSPLDIAQKHKLGQFDSPRRIVPEIPLWLDEVICKCLEKKPEDRYPDAYVLSLRLSEIPRKMALKRAGESDTAYTASSAATAYANGNVPPREVGGTLMSELMRAEIDRQKRGGPVKRLLDNTFVLIALLAATVGLMYWLSQPHVLTEAEMFTAGQELMDTESLDRWQEARTKYFLPLLESNADQWSDVIEPMLDQIALAELKQGSVRRRPGGVVRPRTEPQRLLKLALERDAAGDLVGSRRLLIRLRQLLTEDESNLAMLETLERLIGDADDRLGEMERGEFIQSRLDAADDLEDKGKVEEAETIRRSVVELYRNDDAMRELVERAQSHSSLEN